MGRLAQTVISEHFDLKLSFEEFCLARPDFVEAVEEVRVKRGIKPSLFNSDNPQDESEANHYFDDSNTDRDVKSLLRKFNLPEGWFEVVYFFVVSDSSVRRNGMYKENSGGVVIEEESSQSPEITVRVGAEATRSDFVAAWDHIRQRRGGMSRGNHRSNAKRDFRIFELHREGKTIVEICKIILSEFSEDLDYGNIKKIVSAAYDRNHTPSEYRKQLLTS